MTEGRPAERSIGERLGLLLRDLGVEQAHLVMGGSSEPTATGLLAAAPEIAATITLVLPRRPVDQFARSLIASRASSRGGCRR